MIRIITHSLNTSVLESFFHIVSSGNIIRTVTTLIFSVFTVFITIQQVGIVELEPIESRYGLNGIEINVLKILILIDTRPGLNRVFLFLS